MTRDEERAVEQRTRIREARMTLLAIVNDAEPPAPYLETELRAMATGLMQIERKLGDQYSVRKSRNGKESA